MTELGFVLLGFAIALIAWFSIAVAEEAEREKARAAAHERIRREFR